MSGNGKPLKDILSVIHHLSCDAQIAHSTNRQIIHVDRARDAECLLFHQGSAVMRRKSDHQIVARIHSPSVIGLNTAQASDPWQEYYLQATCELTLERIGMTRLHEVVTANNLWESVCRILSWNINQLCLATLRLGEENPRDDRLAPVQGRRKQKT